MQSSYVRTVQRPFERIRWNPRKHSTVPLLAAIQPRSQRAKMCWKRFTPALIRWIPPPRVLHPIPTHASTALILRKSRMRRRACTDLCGGRSAMVVPTATVITSPAALVPINALVFIECGSSRILRNSEARIWQWSKTFREELLLLGVFFEAYQN
jgi:hypothetical protein